MSFRPRVPSSSHVLLAKPVRDKPSAGRCPKQRYRVSLPAVQPTSISGQASFSCCKLSCLCNLTLMNAQKRINTCNRRNRTDVSGRFVPTSMVNCKPSVLEQKRCVWTFRSNKYGPLQAKCFRAEEMCLDVCSNKYAPSQAKCFRAEIPAMTPGSAKTTPYS